MRNVIVTAVLMLAACLTCKAQAGGIDDYRGIVGVAEKAFNRWHSAHVKFDDDFDRIVAQLNAETVDAALKVRFCASGVGDQIESLKSQFAGQLDDQKRVYKLLEKDADDTITTQDDVLANQKDLADQRRKELEGARKELTFLREQREQLASAAAKVAGLSIGAVTPDIRGALANLDSTVKLTEDRIGFLESAEGPQTDTVKYLIQTKANATAKKARAEHSLLLLGAQKTYWDSFYSMRSAQLTSVCTSDTIFPLPKVAK